MLQQPLQVNTGMSGSGVLVHLRCLTNLCSLCVRHSFAISFSVPYTLRWSRTTVINDDIKKGCFNTVIYKLLFIPQRLKMYLDIQHWFSGLMFYWQRSVLYEWRQKAGNVCWPGCNHFPFFPGSLANGQLNGSGSKGSHKEDGSLRRQGLKGSSEYCEDSPAKKRCVCEMFLCRWVIKKFAECLGVKCMQKEYCEKLRACCAHLV